MVKYAIRLWAGVCLGPRSLKTKQSAINNQQSAKAPCGFHALRPSADWDWDWVAQAWPKGHPSVAQGRPKGRMEQVVLFATKAEKMAGWGRRDRRNRRHRASSHPRSQKQASGGPGHRRDRKSKTSPPIYTDDTDRRGYPRG
jgi:hypothetical protein